MQRPGLGATRTEMEQSTDAAAPKRDEKLLTKKAPPHLRQTLKVSSPSDVLSPFSQKIIAERNSALKHLKPKALKDVLLMESGKAGSPNKENQGNNTSTGTTLKTTTTTPCLTEDEDACELEDDPSSHSPTANRSFRAD